ncbi:hypothetical protein SAMN05660642_01882 [Geodermatophilus siccatus]|uniref:Uncharacterized protein n=1 Tax=Geodermatophilus siccatus TaxID=1137991 RepID=A0A1G9RDN4_9ACTN|nr:hypothetical protein [Geodermatophilus siccatus]SDM21366.1 hypothetical protein SAMN05660642_01882 [Geodermatophilus siccatus]
MVLLALAAVVGALGLVPGRSTRRRGAVHLLFAASPFPAVSP